MNYTIANEQLTVTISDRGAELQSVKGTDGRERIWQGDPAVWGRRSPVLFPLCGRTYEGKSTADGIPCDLPLHGLFQDRVCAVRQIGAQEIAFTQEAGPDTLSRYPYPFRVELVYRLAGNTLTVAATVTNPGDRAMHYAYGAHPGFALYGPLEDYRARFGKKQAVRAVNFTPDCRFPTGGSSPFPLENGDTIPLSEAQFAVGSFFLCEMPDSVTLLRGETPAVTLSYPGFRYLGFWKVAGAPFLCIEPWYSMPAREGEILELSARADFLHLPAGHSETYAYSMTFR